MAEFSLEPASITDLAIFSNPGDLRHDLHAYIQYVSERQVKRMYRSNQIGKADLLRLAKMLSDPEDAAAVRETGSSGWIDLIDDLALKLNLVSYDVKGVYVGYSSAEPSFPDNYIVFSAEKYAQFVGTSLSIQESALIRALIGERDGCKSEFFADSTLSRLDRFSRSGCAVGVVPQIDFVRAREFLLALLEQCPSGEWFSTASLIQYLKREHPYFLIPQTAQYGKSWKTCDQRYGNFMEGKENTWHADIDIWQTDPDAFERVEGRYVERFLEDAPLILGYVDVAYAHRAPQTVYPSRDVLRAFRVNGRLRQALRGRIPQPRVTVQPNLEIYVESDFYPAQVLSKLLPLAEITTRDTITVLRLTKERVAAHLAENESCNVAALLRELSGRELPQNVQREIDEWASHAEKFTLYQGFALLESDTPPDGAHVVEQISPHIYLIEQPQALFNALRSAQQMPVQVHHKPNSLTPLPEQARTAFARQSPPEQPKQREKQPLIVNRQTTTVLSFPDADALEQVRDRLIEQRCPIEANIQARTLTYSQSYAHLVEKALAALPHYIVQIQDI